MVKKFSKKQKEQKVDDDIEVTFKCKGGPIGDVGTFCGKVYFTLLFVKNIYYSTCKNGKINKIEKDVTLTEDELKEICKLFSDRDFNPDEAQDLKINEPDFNGTWTSVKMVSVTELPNDTRETFDFYY